MNASAPPLSTVHQIANEVGASLDQVRYIVRSRNLKPAMRAGNVRLFSPSDAAFIRSELNRIKTTTGGLTNA